MILWRHPVADCSTGSIKNAFLSLVLCCIFATPLNVFLDKHTWISLTPGRNNNNMASYGLAYDGCNFFRQRLVLSTLSGKRVKIKNIRSRDDDPGLRGELQLHSAEGKCYELNSLMKFFYCCQQYLSYSHSFLFLFHHLSSCLYSL